MLSGKILDLGETKRRANANNGKTIWRILKEVLHDPEKGNVHTGTQHALESTAYAWRPRL